MSSVKSRDVAGEPNSPLEFGGEVSVEDSLREGESKSRAEEHDKKSCQ